MQWLLDAITGVYEKLIATLKGWYQTLVDSFKWVVTSIIDFIKWLVNWLLDLGWKACESVYNLFLGDEGFVWYVFDFIIGLGDQFLEAFPDIGELLAPYEQTFTTVMTWMSALNAFLPVQEACYLSGIYVGFVAVLVLIRVILKAIPGTGG